MAETVERQQGPVFSGFGPGFGPNLAVALGLFFAGAAAILYTGVDSPAFHTILDTSVVLTGALIALLLWDVSRRTHQGWPLFLAVSFGILAFGELLHTLAALGVLNTAGGFGPSEVEWRAGSWGPPAHLLPIGVGAALLLRDRPRVFGWALAASLILLGAILFAVFMTLPRYVPPGILGITRPTLVLVPLLWIAVGIGYWRHRDDSEIARAIAPTAIILAIAHITMLYSRSPNDPTAMVAHLGKFVGDAFFLFSLTQIGATDTARRFLAENELLALNRELDRRVREQTDQLRTAYDKLAEEIVEHRKSAARLQESEERAHLIVDTALDAVVSMDSSGAIIEWSARAETTFGWAAREVLGTTVAEIILPQRYRARHKEGLERYLATGETRVLNKRVEVTALHRDGHEFPAELSITPLRSGDAVTFNAFVRDITDRKVAETRLKTQLDRLRLLDQITRAISQRHDLKSTFQVAVRSLEERLPADFVCVCSYDKARNVLTVDHVGIESAPLGRELRITERAEIEIGENGLSRCLRGVLVYEPDMSALDYPFPQRLAREDLRSLVIVPLMIEREAFGVMVVARFARGAFNSSDCEFLNQLGEHVALAAQALTLRTSLERAYDDLKQTQQAILQQERLRALGQMASGIAHDINNAISPVSVYTQSLIEREPNLSTRTREYLEVVGRVVKDVSATVGRMRDFYRRDDADTEFEPLVLNDLVPQVVELTRARWSDMPQRRGIVIAVVNELEQDLPPVMGNAAELREAVTNLIFNAVDAMPDGGTITIRTQSLPGLAASEVRRVRLTVGDSGVGMDEAARRRCLEPFFTTKGERGTGLGLAMVYGTAQRHKAALDIDSAPGEGTRVALEFAATVPERQGAQPVRDLLDVPPLRLLLVDDDPAVLNSTQEVLELDGHIIQAANGGVVGLERMRAAKESGETFDVIVTDLGMPYVDGNEVARTAKALFPTATIILLTGWGRRMGGREDPPDSVDYVLPKPLDLDELREIFIRHAPARN